ncbi:hypothetical protein V3C99_017499 [Haemonchus contortus]|uniref:Uncharacterized protein n=1 Tax=Haemonchus contortus TaxID=6289 RepID=A0A7I4Z4A7_HAECO
MMDENDFVEKPSTRMDALGRWVRRVNRPLPELTPTFLRKVIGRKHYYELLLRYLRQVQNLYYKLDDIFTAVLNFLDARLQFSLRASDRNEQRYRRKAVAVAILMKDFEDDLDAFKESFNFDIMAIATYHTFSDPPQLPAFPPPELTPPVLSPPTITPPVLTPPAFSPTTFSPPLISPPMLPPPPMLSATILPPPMLSFSIIPPPPMPPPPPIPLPYFDPPASPVLDTDSDYFVSNP